MRVPVRMAHLHLGCRKEAIKSIQDSKRCQRRDSEMTTATFVFLILFICMVSSDTWLRVYQCSDLDLYGPNEEKMSHSAILYHKKAAFHDKTNVTWKR